MLAHPERSTCSGCRREQVINVVAAAGTGVSRDQIIAAVDAVADRPTVLRSLSAALTADPNALAQGAPGTVTRLVIELIDRGAAGLAVPACIVCGRIHPKLVATGQGGVCPRCRHHQRATACCQCGQVKPVAGRLPDGQPICERCRRWERGLRPCGICGTVAPIAVRARGDSPDVCVNCYRMPEAVCSGCGRRRECNFATSDRPICASCSPRNTARCAHCGHQRPPVVRWAEGPICDPCYTAALRRRGRCAQCGDHRRLVTPPGPSASTCADCAGLPVTHTCTDCGVEDRLYAKGRCERCTLRRRATALLSGPDGHVPAELAGVLNAICAARVARSALNWLRQGNAARLLSDLAAGRLSATHAALDAHPDRHAADYLRHMLMASGALPSRDDDLARVERWLAERLTELDAPEHRHLVQAFATWRVIRALRQRSATSQAPRTPTGHARLQITTAMALLTWLSARGRPLTQARQADIDDWLLTSPSACHARTFLAWAAERGHCPTFTVPTLPRTNGTATDSEERWTLASRLLHDDQIPLTDRVAGSFLLLFGQQQSRIAAMTTDQIINHDDGIYVRFARHEIPLPKPLAILVLRLINEGRSNVGIGSPAGTPWLFPGGLPGRPITASRLAERLRKLGIPTMPGRRAALLDLAAKLPAAVLADLLDLHPTTAAKWIREAGGGWSRYAAEIARSRNHQA